MQTSASDLILIRLFQQKRAGQGQHRAADGEHQPEQTVRAAEALQQRLIGKPFADKTVQGRQCGDSHRADQKAEGRDLLGLPGPLHLLGLDPIAPCPRALNSPGTSPIPFVPQTFLSPDEAFRVLIE